MCPIQDNYDISGDSTHSASEARFVFEACGNQFSVIDFTAREEISSPFQIDLTVASEVEVGFEEMKFTGAVFTVKGSSEISTPADRYFHGIIRKMRVMGTRGRLYLYKFQMVPEFWLLSIRVNCRIFQHTTVEKIIATILEEHFIPGDSVRFRLKREVIPRKFCVQYQENDLQFVSRLLEEEGIYYFFEHWKDRHILIFCDSPAYYRSISGKSTVPFNTSASMVPAEESVFAFYRSQRIRADRFSHRNHNFKTPTLVVAAEDAVDEGEKEVYEFPGPFVDNNRGTELAQIRLQEIHTLKDKGFGQSVCPRFIAGSTFSLTDHSSESLNAEYLLIEVIHTGTQPQVLQDLAGEAYAQYSNSFLVIPASVSYRPERITTKPLIAGIQTARVTGPPGEEIYTDRYGRVKVQFRWDREGKDNEQTSCWVRVAQFWNGLVSGTQFVPRVGDEVLVAFVDGDVDFPLILGSSVNENNLPNYPLPQSKTISGIRTNSCPNGGPDNFHELRFDDRKGSEEVYLQSERDWNILVKHDRGETVGNDLRLEINNNRSEEVRGDDLEAIGRNKEIRVGNRLRINAGDSVEIVCGQASIRLDNSGEVTITGTKLRLAGAEHVQMVGSKVDIN